MRLEDGDGEDLGVLAAVEDVDLEGGGLRVDIQGEVVAVGGDIGEAEADDGAREVVVLGRDGGIAIQRVEGEDGVRHGKDTRELQLQVVVRTGEPGEEGVPPRAVGRGGLLGRQDSDALLEGATQLLRLQRVGTQVLLAGLRLQGAGIALAATQEAERMRLLIVDIVDPADAVVGHGDSTDTRDILVRLARVAQNDRVEVGRGMLGDDIGRMRHLDDIVLILIHIRVMDAEEDPHILQVEVRPVVDRHPHHVVTVPKEPLRLRFDAHIDIRRLQEETLKRPVEMLLTELHIRQQFVVDTLVATTEEMVIDLLTALVHLALVGIIFRLQEIRREEAVALHGGGIETPQVLSLGRPREVVTPIVAVEHIRELCRLARILHTGLMEPAHRPLFIPHLLQQEALEDQGRSRAGGVASRVAREKRGRV